MTWLGRIPGVQLAQTYRRAWLGNDAVSAAVLTTLLVPAGMGYAQASGLEPITGLYATMVALVAYAVVGPSRILVMSPDSSLVPLVAAAIVPLAGTDPDERLALASMMALLAGGLCIAAGLARFGFIADLLSKPVRYGYLNGIALIVAASQLARLLGFSVDADLPFSQLRAVAQGIADGAVVPSAAILGVGALAVLVATAIWWPKFPGPLVVVVLGIAAVALLELDGELSVVGSLPQGLPSFEVPSVAWSDLGPLIAGAVGIAFVAFADTSVLSRTFARRRREHVDANHELVALGMTNVAVGLFQGLAVSASSTRTAVAVAAGSRSQLTGVLGAVLVGLLLVLAPDLFQYLPTSVLAAIVIVAAARLVEVRGMVRLWRANRAEFVLAVVCFLAVALLGPIRGIGLAVLLSVLDFVRRAWRPHTAQLVRVDGVKGYHDAARHPEGRRVPGLVLYRFDAPLFFANADVFKAEVLSVVDASSEPVRWVVVTAEPITDVDSTAADALLDLRDELERRGVVLAFAELKGFVRERMQAYGVVARVGPERFFRTIGLAVKAYVAETGAAWTDWEDRPT